MSNNLSCPSCDAKIAVMPKARSKCKFCKEWIYIKAKFGSKVKVLMTKSQSDDVDRLYKNKKTDGASRFIAKYEPIAVKAAKDGQLLKARDLFLELKGKAITKDQRKSYHNAFIQCDLVSHDLPDVHHVQVFQPDYKQPGCRMTKGDIFPISKILDTMPIPCDAELCTCGYNWVFDDEL